VLGGVHGSERASVEVASRLVAILDAGFKHSRSVTILPSLFPANYAHADRSFRARLGAGHPTAEPDEATGRRTVLSDGTLYRDPNRNMPQVGRCHRSSELRDALGFAIEAENLFLLDLVAQTRPVGIVSVHCIGRRPAILPEMQGRLNLPGIFVDPVTDLDLHITRKMFRTMPEICESDELALTASSLVRTRQRELIRQGEVADRYDDLRDDWVVGNWLDSPTPTARYARPNGIDEGVSLGEWGSRAVNSPSIAEHRRPGIPIFTVEVRGYYTSTDFDPTITACSGTAGDAFQLRKEQQERVWELQVHAEAIAEIFLR
jgi:hypothetical protein